MKHHIINTNSKIEPFQITEQALFRRGDQIGELYFRIENVGRKGSSVTYWTYINCELVNA